MIQLLFVYGTLRRNGLNQHLMECAEWLYCAKLYGAQLYEIDWYPGVVENGEAAANSHVIGDVYRVTRDEHWLELDRYEGIRGDETDEYRRAQRMVNLENGDERICQVYLFKQAVDPTKRVASGDWLEYLAQKESAQE